MFVCETPNLFSFRTLALFAFRCLLTRRLGRTALLVLDDFGGFLPVRARHNRGLVFVLVRVDVCDIRGRFASINHIRRITLTELAILLKIVAGPTETSRCIVERPSHFERHQQGHRQQNGRKNTHVLE